MKSNYSNPAKFTVSDSGEEKEFTYVGGQTPYNVHLRIDSWIPISVLVFADSKKQAKQIVVDALDFGIKCHTSYCEVFKNDKNDMSDIANTKLSSIKSIREHIDDIEVQQASRDQIYRIGWADNDTF